MSTATQAKYRFARIQCHPKIPHLFGWYLVITRDDIELFFSTHKKTAQGQFMRLHRDPHFYDQKTWKPASEIAEHLYNPVKLSAGWLQTAEKAMQKHGVIYVNDAGGMCFGNVLIVEERERDTLQFPKIAEVDPDLRITISRWGDGLHFYLSAERPIITSQDKYNTVEEAHAEACRHTLPKNIKVRDGGVEFRYTREGD